MSKNLMKSRAAGRGIHTGLYGSIALKAVKKICNAVSKHHVLCGETSYVLYCMQTADIDETNEVIMFSKRPFAFAVYAKNTSDETYCRRLAHKADNVLKSHEKSGRGLFSKKDTSYVNVVIARFLGRSLKKMDKDIVDKVLGKPRDPVTSEMLTSLHAEIEDAKRQHEDETGSLMAARDILIDKAKADCRNAVKLANEKWSKKIKELEQMAEDLLEKNNA